VRRLDVRAPLGPETPGKADVVRDLVQPGRLELGYDAFAQRCVHAKKRVLHGVLGILM
jgi:hypothetical protein